jgi:hypothetical protein
MFLDSQVFVTIGPMRNKINLSVQHIPGTNTGNPNECWTRKQTVASFIMTEALQG